MGHAAELGEGALQLRDLRTPDVHPAAQRGQDSLLEGLSSYLGPKGLEVEAVLIRDIILPSFISKAIESKKEREQAVERERARDRA